MELLIDEIPVIKGEIFDTYRANKPVTQSLDFNLEFKSSSFLRIYSLPAHLNLWYLLSGFCELCELYVKPPALP